MKRTICILISVTVFIAAFSALAFADEAEVSDMVYAADSDREQIYQATLSDEFDPHNARLSANLGVSIIKESITPVYYINMLDYAKTGILDIYPSAAGSGKKGTNKKSEVYIAKMITSDGKFAGNICFTYINGAATAFLSFPSENFPDKDENITRRVMSASYADHAERIQQLLNKDKFVSPYDVKLVLIDYVGYFFYVDTEDTQAFIPLGTFYKTNGDCENRDHSVLYTDDIKELAKKQLAEYERIEAYAKEWEENWKKEHPDESYTIMDMPLLSGLPSTPVSVCGKINDITNIFEYLKLDMQTDALTADDINKADTTVNDIDRSNTAADDINEANTSNWLLYGVIALASCAAVGGAMLFVIRKKKSKA